MIELSQCCFDLMIVLSASILLKYECRMGYLFVLSWAMMRWVFLGSVVSVCCILSGGVFAILLWFLLLRYLLTMVVCMCFMFVLICVDVNCHTTCIKKK